MLLQNDSGWRTVPGGRLTAEEYRWKLIREWSDQ